ncbi:MAG: glycine reductase, partial [Anderseniella sp.]|nr:glycine reductase [Anderseniella sp.]
ALALDLLETATGPRTTLTSPLEWDADHSWKWDYSNPDRADPEELARQREEFERVKQQARANRT